MVDRRVNEVAAIVLEVVEEIERRFLVHDILPSLAKRPAAKTERGHTAPTVDGSLAPF